MFPAMHLLLLLMFIFLLFPSNGMSNVVDAALGRHQFDKFSFGAIVDYGSRAGKEEKVAIKMAIKDFYTHFIQPPTLHFKNSRGDPVQAASSVKNLVKKHHAIVVVGLGTWQVAELAANLGNKSQVPILSLANEVPSWACSYWPFLVNAARNQFAQMKAVAAIIGSWQWRKVNIIYEDTISAVNSITPYLIDALQEVEAEINELIPLTPFPQFYSLSGKLKNLKKGQCRVFIVHTSSTLATNIFKEAKKLGMMEKEFVWITTISITNVIDTLNKSVVDSMQGILGIKSYYSHSRKQFKGFRSRFRVMFHKQYPKEKYTEPGIFALQAYDAVRAVALAVKGDSDWQRYPNLPNDDHTFSLCGQTLLNRILKSKFEGLTGAFSFENGMLAPAHIYRIVNVAGKSYREVGYWTEGLGFSESVAKGSIYNESMKILGQILWPGGPWTAPRGWAVATNAKPLRVGVPMGNSHSEFVNVRLHPSAEPNITGFSIDVFKAIVDRLPYNLPYEFIPFQGTYDSLVNQLQLENFDAVVGDTAIVANRSRYAEFSQPYADPGVQLLVPAKLRRLERAWLFKKPFTSPMWAATGSIVLFNGFVVWLIERKHNKHFRKGSILNQAGTMVSLAFTTLFSLQGEKLHSNLSRMTMVVWLFLALVITQSYTASLTSLLTVQRLDPATVDIEMLRRIGAKVGCDGNSFVVKYLEEVLEFQSHNIKKIYSDDDYPEALLRGDIAAAFLEVPYVKVFLAKYCNGFTTGQIFKVGGFGFVFRRSSPYIPDISRAVLEISEKGKLLQLENSMMSTYKCSVLGDDKKTDSLGLDSFGGLFLITLGTSAISLIIFIARSIFTSSDGRIRFRSTQFNFRLIRLYKQ